jgi:hypothetical protein
MNYLMRGLSLYYIQMGLMEQLELLLEPLEELLPKELLELELH